MPKKIKTKADQPPQGEKKGTIQCCYCPCSFSRRNCYRHHLTKHKDILYAEKNELQTLLNEQENQFQIQPITTTRRTPLAPISFNELSIVYENSGAYEDARAYEDAGAYKDVNNDVNNDYESHREKMAEELHNNVAIKKSILMYYVI